MEQLLLHLVGDYLTQTNKMATEKVKSSLWAVIHAVIYALPFLLIGSWIAVLVIFKTHFLIDRFRLAKYVVFAKNWVTEPGSLWKNCQDTGYHKDIVPPWIAVWLLIIADNTIHLCINYAALRWL